MYFYGEDGTRLKTNNFETEKDGGIVHNDGTAAPSEKGEVIQEENPDIESLNY